MTGVKPLKACKAFVLNLIARLSVGNWKTEKKCVSSQVFSQVNRPIQKVHRQNVEIVQS